MVKTTAWFSQWLADERKKNQISLKVIEIGYDRD